MYFELAAEIFIFDRMKNPQSAIPYYNDINEFLTSISIDRQTSNPLFYCLRLKEHKGDIYKPPFRRGFYFFALFTQAGNTKITHGTTKEANLNSFLVFQSPGLIYSFYRDSTAHGYLIYFKAECFSFFKPDFQNEFPFFNQLHTNLFKFDEDTYNNLSPYFEDVFSTYEKTSADLHIEARIKLLALLYHMKQFVADRIKMTRFATPEQLLFGKYVQLINNHYIDKRTVKEYADLLSVTPNHLSQSVKAVSGRNALSYIAERLVNEAKSLIQYTDLDISEIAHQLGFSDLPNFGKFFKKEVGIPPSAYKKRKSE